MSPHHKNRQSGRRRLRKRVRNLGADVALLWALSVACWLYTGWAWFSTFVRHRHVHIYTLLLGADLFFPVIAVVLTYEWWRSPKKK